MPHKAETVSVTNILTALGNTTRFRLVSRLSKAETFTGLSISELTEASGLTRQAVTKHLEALAEAGLVVRRKPGRTTWFELRTEAVVSVIEALEALAKRRARSERRLKLATKKILGSTS